MDLTLAHEHSEEQQQTSESYNALTCKLKSPKFKQRNILQS